jgi:protein SCO1/2
MISIKTFVAIAVVLLVSTVEIIHFNRLESGYYDRLPKCFPTGAVYQRLNEKGLAITDSIYHTIAAYKLTDQNGHLFTNDSLKGKIYVANFFFCNCKLICPRMTFAMEGIQSEFKNQPNVSLISHTISPEQDSVPVLKKYADDHGVDERKWHLLTGTRSQIFDLIKNSYYLAGPADTEFSFSHNSKFVLVDAKRIIRGLL